jgi:hypothetical protein
VPTISFRGRVPIQAIVGTVVLFGVVLAVAGFGLSAASQPAEARFPINNFTNVDDTATVTPSGQNVAVTGWVKCTDGHIAEIRVTATQGATEASGRTHVRCLGQTETELWEIHVATHGPATFDTSRTVEIDAWAVTRARGDRTAEPHTWSNPVTLLER